MKEEKKMIYAPVLIPTLCRYTHLIRCIESLKNNTWARYTDIYIGLDYPKSESHWNGYNKICKYLEQTGSEFKSFNVIKRNENYGSSKNMNDLYKFIFKKYDRVIRTDDDAEFSPNFLEYMNKCLMHYENNKNIIGVTGYSYPIDWHVDNSASIFEENFICPVWGIGFWRDKFHEFHAELTKGYLRKNFNSYLSNIANIELTDARFLDYINSALSWSDNNLIDRASDVGLGIYLALEKKAIVMPTLSKVRNHGFDGSGEYCQKMIEGNNILNDIDATNYNYSMQPIDERKNFDLIPSFNNNYEKNRNLMNNFDRRPNILINKAKLKIFLYNIFGEEIYRNIWIAKNKNKR